MPFLFDRAGISRPGFALQAGRAYLWSGRLSKAANANKNKLE